MTPVEMLLLLFFNVPVKLYKNNFFSANVQRCQNRATQRMKERKHHKSSTFTGPVCTRAALAAGSSARNCFVARARFAL